MPPQNITETSHSRGPTPLLDSNHQLVVPTPTRPPTTLFELFLFRVLFPTLGPLFLSYKCITDSFFRKTIGSVYTLVSSATSQPVSNEWYFQDKSLLSRLWTMESAKCYLNDQGEPQLEYQLREGYCGSATQRCVLKSLGYINVREQKGGESKPQLWCEHVTEMARESCHGAKEEVVLDTTIVEGGVSYEEFVKAIRDGLGNKNCRIACNFLRPALMGFAGWRIFPMNFLLGMMGGHFSPILGMLDVEEVDSPLVAIWDTNHKYNGAYFVPAKRLYDAVHAVDLSAHKHRALILVTKKGL
ncbi:hypothetical protein HJC23_012890 [Cyclotella cryptica]|uniref:glutathione gamma-glutamylcysteinyltransferase n=1 Tax=Cyclotella cryptica TaxID=29204 RepID=A0ABD3Q185_9STRA|eukprot:CCRYP_009507-RA/>CCRYP_009507-RA protein AED:0.00 eAED:0.00 QI:200/-1/1/1/-1/1/1/160/299